MVSIGTSWILILGIYLVESNEDDASFKRRKILDDILQSYDPRIPPSYDKGYPVHNKVQLYILSIDSISDSSMDYTMSFYLRQRWNDTRLAFNSSSGIDVIELDTRMMDQIWTPDTYIINEKEARFHYVTMPNRMMYLYPDGTVLYSSRVSGSFTCNLKLLKYPLDKQICDIRMESYGHSARSILIRWRTRPVEMAPTLSLPQFNITKMTSFNCDTAYMDIQYTCIGLRIHLSRNIGYYLAQIYVPSILIVILSWVNFWLNVDAVPARITMGLLTVLTMTTQSASSVVNLQKVSYIKALDVWLAACLFFVFAALVEFAWVNVSFRVETRRKSLADLPALISDSNCSGDSKEHLNGKIKGSTNSLNSMNGLSLQSSRRESARNREKARTIDRISRVVFPLLFLLFNIVYWVFYLVWEPE